MNERTLARESAFKFFYQCIFSSDKEINESFIESSLNDFSTSMSISKEQKEFIQNLSLISSTNLEPIQESIQEKLTGWKIDRLAKIDLTLLILGVCEMKFLDPPTPGKVVINEYVELAKKYGSEESKSFVNGILDKFFHQ